MKRNKMKKIMTDIAIFKGLLFAKFNGRRKPIIANLLLTNRCNLKCFYCYVDVFHRSLPDIQTDKIIEIINILHKKGTRVIVLLGGEPLLRNDIGKIIEHVKKKGMVCELITNGYLVKKWISSLKLVDSVCVSLDGNEISNDLNRGTGSFRVAVDSIKLLQENNINTRIKAVITQNNIDSIEYVADYARKNRLLMTASVAVVYEERSYEIDTKWLSNDETRQFLKKLRDLKTASVPIGYSFRALDYCINWPWSYNKIAKREDIDRSVDCIKCLRKDFSLYMDAEGTIYPCASLWGKSGKNILKDGFDVAWDNFKNYNCFCCGNIPDVDISLLLNLTPKSVLNALRYF